MEPFPKVFMFGLCVGAALRFSCQLPHGGTEAIAVGHVFTHCLVDKCLCPEDLESAGHAPGMHRDIPA